MNEDPRWQRMADIAAWATAHEATGEGGEFARRVEEYFATAKAIAADAAAPAEDRAVARQILKTLDRMARANATALLAAAARIARDPNATPEERAEFADLLARATELMPAASNQRH